MDMERKENKISIMTPKVAIGRIQNLAGKAIGVYQNDRAPDRADRLVPLLEAIFNICVEVRSRWKS